MSKYNLEYLGVVCTGVDWKYPDKNVFYFTYDGKNYIFTQVQDVHCEADTDHIKRVIKEQFLPRIKLLESVRSTERRSEMSYTDKELQYVHELISENARLTATNKLLTRVNEELESQNNWISIKDRLPEINKEHPHECDVLVYVPKREGVHQHGIYIGARGKVNADPKGEHNFWGVPTQECDWVIHGWSYFKHPIVTHWMPLPKAPIEEEEQNNEART